MNLSWFLRFPYIFWIFGITNESFDYFYVGLGFEANDVLFLVFILDFILAFHNMDMKLVCLPFWFGCVYNYFFLRSFFGDDMDPSSVIFA